jgi:hypothetical protein
MTLDQEKQTSKRTIVDDWSNRLFLLAMGAILFLTEYPFEFSARGKPHRGMSPLMLGYGSKSGLLDVILNILLFVPFGFALGSKLLRHKRWKSALLYSAIAGAVFSYLIELSQLYIPQRDSGWEDVFTNTTGAVTGFLLFSVLGVWLFKRLSESEEFVRRWATPRRLAAILVAYFAVWCVISGSLERETRLDDWSGDCFLLVGSRAGTRRPWAGELSELQIWDYALPERDAERITRKESAESIKKPLVSLDFAQDPPLQNNAQLFIPFRPISSAGTQGGGEADEFAGSSTKPVAALVERVKRANQFSIHAVMKAGEGAGSIGRIISLAERSGFSELYLGQSKESLLFWFRNPAFSRRSVLLWKTPKVLTPDGSSDVLFSYDGSNVEFFMGGQRLQNHRLGPGTTFATRFRYPVQSELDAYRDLYYAAVFFPAGALLGVALSGIFLRRFGAWAVAPLVAVDALIAPAVFEWILMRESQSAFSMANFGLAAGIVILGLCWAKADGQRQAKQVSLG